MLHIAVTKGHLSSFEITPLRRVAINIPLYNCVSILYCLCLRYITNGEWHTIETVWVRCHQSGSFTRSSAVAERPRVIEYFAKSLRVTQGHSK